MTINQKVEKLRNVMLSHNIDAVIIPSNDPHQSEYVAENWKYREWISGFTGSAGTVVVASKTAGLWTDSRYYLQGEQELKGTCIALYKTSDPSYSKWLSLDANDVRKVAIDGNICSIAQLKSLEIGMKRQGIELVTDLNLVSLAWDDQPDMPLDEIYAHDVKYNGESRAEKLKRIRIEMKKRGAQHHLISTLDDIAWIFNIRGSDVDFNPVAVAYALIHLDNACLYIHPDKVPAVIKTILEKDDISCRKYTAIVADLNKLPESESILIDPTSCNVIQYRAINAKILRGKTISRYMKSIKNATEITHSKNVMVKDAVALAHTFYWLDSLLKNGDTCTEADFSDKLIHHRSQQENYVGESFPAIIGYKSNGAIIHYRPIHGKSAEIKSEGILLADSGGQYLDGTTDITRTIALGTPTPEQKRNFTLVLKGHIELARAKFPKETTGGQLDTLARMHLWSHGLNYGHGTGHGVGFFLNVHEPPQGFTPPPSERATTKHEPGMYSSNEPGYYKEGEYGIRIENLLFTVESKIEGFYEFDTITLYPLDMALVDTSLITKAEKNWINEYQNEVFNKVSPLLEGDIKAWFKSKCKGI